METIFFDKMIMYDCVIQENYEIASGIKIHICQYKECNLTGILLHFNLPSCRYWWTLVFLISYTLKHDYSLEL